jgi:cytosine permease
MIALAISAFPGACFSSLIAANSFKTTMPKIDPYITVGIGTLVAVVLAVSGVVETVIWVFVVIGASFGPVCGAMLADYLLSGGKWSGPRAGFNPAGWISWIVGFAVGSFDLVVDLLLKWNFECVTKACPNLVDYWHYVPMPPVTAFVVGFALYLVLSVLGLRTRKLDMPALAA